MNTKHLPILITLICLTIAHIPAHSQTGPAIQWQNTIGGSDFEFIISVQQTTNGGYILGGSSSSNISGDKTENCLGVENYWIVKTDSAGNIQWQNTIGGNGQDVLYSIRKTTDGGYILGGFSNSDSSGDKTESNIGNWDYWIVKVDNLGSIQWQNTIGGIGDDELFCIQQTTDGGYILGGYSNSPVSGDKTENSNGDYDYWMVKTDSLGNIQWQNTIGGMDREVLLSIKQTIDGGYILGGNSNSNISGDKTENSNGNFDYWMIKTDSVGNIQWQNTIGGNSDDFFFTILETTDGGYMLAGWSSSSISGDKTENSNGDYDYWIVKTDNAGNIQWQNSIGGNGIELLYSIEQTTDGGYIIGGPSDSNISGDKNENSFGYFDYWIVKTDSTGNIHWQNTIGGNLSDELGSIKQTTDGGYILAGHSQSNISGDKTENCIGIYDYWIIKLGPDTITSTSNIKLQTSNFSISPNPAKDNITLQIPNYLNSSISITITSTMGQIMYTSTVSNTPKQLIIPISTYPKGMYVAKVMSGDRVYTSKFVIN